MTPLSPDFSVSIDLVIRPIGRGQHVPAELIAALERCSRLGGGEVNVVISASRDLFFHYSEFPLSCPTWAEGNETDAQPVVAEGEDPGASSCDEICASVDGAKDAVDDALPAFGSNIDAEPDVYRAFPAGNNQVTGEPHLVFGHFQNPSEVRDWPSLAAFLTADRFSLGCAEGCLVTVYGRTFLATFEPLPETGGAVR